jgi:hypothetical protein
LLLEVKREPGGNDKRGAGVGRRSDSSEGKPLEGEPQERYRHETRLERCRAERSVERLRKPESAAQPGVGNPGVGRCPMPKRWRGEEPQESRSRFLCLFSDEGRKRGGTGRVTPSSGAKGHERIDDFLPKIIYRVCRKDLMVHPGGEARRGSVEPNRHYRQAL